MTCGKEQNPERFHSHPVHMTKFKEKDKEKPAKESRSKNTNTKKRVVTKPLPLMYKSKKVLGKVNSHRPIPDDLQQLEGRLKNNRKNKSAESLPNVDQRDQRRKKKTQNTRSADNSPHRNKPKLKKEKAEPTLEHEDESRNEHKNLPLSHYIKQSKSSTNSKSEDFTIDIFEKESKPQQPKEDAPFYNPHRHNKSDNNITNNNYNYKNNSNNTFSGMNTANRGGATGRRNTIILKGRGEMQANGNVLKRPIIIDERLTDEPSDEEIETIEFLSKSLPNVPEDAVMDTPPEGKFSSLIESMINIKIVINTIKIVIITINVVVITIKIVIVAMKIVIININIVTINLQI